MSYFVTARKLHPKKVGDYHNGERITSTYYRRENGVDVAYLKTESRKEYKA